MVTTDAIADSWLAHLECHPEAVPAVAAVLCRCVQALPRAAAAQPPQALSHALDLRGGGLRRSAVTLRMLGATQPRLAMVLRRHLLALAVLRTDDGRWASAGGASTLQLRPWLATLCSEDYAGSEAQVAARAAAAGAWALDIASASRIDALGDEDPTGRCSGASAVIALCIRRLSVVTAAHKREEVDAAAVKLASQTNAHCDKLNSVQRRLMISELCQHLLYAAPRWRSRLCCAIVVFLPFYLSKLRGAQKHEHSGKRIEQVQSVVVELVHLVDCVMEVLECDGHNSETDTLGKPEAEPEPEPEPARTSPLDADEQWSEDWSEQQHWEAALRGAPILPADDDLSLREFVLAFIATDAWCLPLLAQLSQSDLADVGPEVSALLSRLVLLGHEAVRNQQAGKGIDELASEHASKSDSESRLQPKLTEPTGSEKDDLHSLASRNDSVSNTSLDSKGEREQSSGKLAGAPKHQTHEADEADGYSDSFDPSSGEEYESLEPVESNDEVMEAADSEVTADRAELQLHLQLHPATLANLYYALVYCGLILLPTAYLPRKVRQSLSLVPAALQLQHTTHSASLTDKHSVPSEFVRAFAWLILCI